MPVRSLCPEHSDANGTRSPILTGHIATKWNSGESEAWLRLGEAQEKLKDHKAAREAYSKYLELAADAKNAEEIRKKVEKLK